MPMPCAARGYGQRSLDRRNTRNGYRRRGWDTRAGSIDLAIPKLREGSYFPDWLLERRRRAESALISVVATSYLLGVSTRRMEKLVEQLQLAIGLGCGRPCKWFWGRIGCGKSALVELRRLSGPNFPADVEHNLAHDRIAANHRDVVSP